MTVLGQDVLTKVGKKDKPLKTWLETWLVTAEAAEWESLSGVQASYPSADGVTLVSGTVVTVFNAKGNNYRMLAWIDYDAQVVEVLEVITHAEYDKEMWKARY